MAPRQGEEIHQEFDFNNLYRDFISIHSRINRQQVILAIKLRDKSIELGRALEELATSNNDPIVFTRCLDLRHDMNILQGQQNEFQEMQRGILRTLNRLLLNVALNDPNYYTIRRDY